MNEAGTALRFECLFCFSNFEENTVYAALKITGLCYFSCMITVTCFYHVFFMRSELAYMIHVYIYVCYNNNITIAPSMPYIHLMTVMQSA